MNRLRRGRVSRFFVTLAVATALVVTGSVWAVRRTAQHVAVVYRKNSASTPAVSRLGKQSLRVAPETAKSLGIRLVQARRARDHEQLTLSGSLFLDPNRLVHVHSRFAGEVVSIGTDAAKRRPLRLGDHVTKGELLAVVWCKDVGEKKSDLVDAISQLVLDRAQYDSLSNLGQDVVAKRQLREAERQVEADIIRIERLERTLRSWRLTEAEIDIVRAEAEKVHRIAERRDHEHGPADLAIDKSWAEVEVRSPMDGVILEKNIVAGDIVDTNLDIFKIADLSVLGVMANIYEEDLPAVESLAPNQRHWKVYLRALPDAEAVPGEFSLIGNLVDPNQHTAALMGWLDNKDGQLRAGQFISARVEIPSSEDEVVLPDSAVLQEGSESVVFVGKDPTGQEVTRRVVALASRGDKEIYIRSEPTAAQAAAGCQPLHAGEWVLVSGAVEIDGAYQNALATGVGSEAERK